MALKLPGKGNQNPMTQPQAQTQQTRRTGGIFSGIEDAQMSFGSNYVKDGHYYMLIRNVKEGTTRKRIGFVAIELTVLACLDRKVGGEPRHRDGEEVSHLLMADKDAFMGNLKAFIVHCYGVEESEVTDEVCREICVEDKSGQDSPMAGKLIELVARTIITKAKQQPFTVVDYKGPVTYKQVADALDGDTGEALIDRVFGKGVFQAALEAEGV